MSGHDSSPSERPPSSAPKQSSRSVEKTPRLPVWRRAMPSSSRSSSSGSMRTFESEPMQSAIPRCSIRAAGRKPSARSASVVGQAQTVVPLCASRSSSAPSACVAWTTVTCGPRQPVRSRSSIGRQPCSARHSSISRGCSSAWMCSGRLLGRRVAPELLEPLARAGADGVGGKADADAVGAQRLELAQILGRRLLAHPRQPAAARRRRAGGRARSPASPAASAAARASSRPR